MRRRTILPLYLSWIFLASAPTVLFGQEYGPLEEMAADGNSSIYRDQARNSQYSLDYSLGLMIQREIIAQLPVRERYSSLGSYLEQLRSRGLEESWNQQNQAYLSKPIQERTGEGLIPDIQIPLPGLGRVLGSGAQIKVGGNQKITVGNEITRYNQKGRDLDASKTADDRRINIKQEQRVNLEGVIGERVHVLIDYDSEADLDKRSKIRLRYDGKEDEVLQSLEAGDTEFSLSGSSLVGGMTTVHKGLFGLKGVARLGGLELTAIASKDEGQSQTSSFSGTSQKDSFAWDDRDYMQYQIYEILPQGLPDNDSLEVVKVFTTNSYSNLNTKTHLLIDRSRRDFAGGSDTIYGPVPLEVRAEITDFILDDPRWGRIILSRPLEDASVLGVAYKTRRGRYYPSRHDFENHDTLMLVKPANCQPPGPVNGYCWNYQLRNYYSLKKSGVDFATLSIKLQYLKNSQYVDYDSASGRSFLEILGLSNSQGVLYDNLINQEEGYFFFPMARPFTWPALPDSNPDIYNLKNLDSYVRKFRFLITYRTNLAVYYLNAPGRLLEGTVKATINGVAVPAGDYSVDYELGTVTFSERVKQQLQASGASLNIDYQYLPSFALGSKTLAGMRGIYKFGDSGQLGGTWLYRSEQTPDQKPRLGEEPRRIIVAGLDGNYQSAPEVLTRLADILPLVETEAPSSFRLTGELAGNFPNPNTKGQVYIDDMDGSKVSDEFLLSRSAWVRSSPPPGKTDSLLAKTFYWYNPSLQVRMKEINPSITDETKKDETLQTLMLRYESGQADTANGWAGITHLLSKTGLDLSQSRLLNLWIKGYQGIVHIDIGRNINEDQVWWKRNGTLHRQNGRVDCEPLNANRQAVYTDAGDLGMDRVAGDDQLTVPGDDGNDDYFVDIASGDYRKINGTEGNGLYDSEDLKGNGLDTSDAPQLSDNYYTFRFDLSRSLPNQYGWHQLSALLDTARVVGANLGWNSIQYARIWVDSCPAQSAFQIAMVEVSGNRWLSQGAFTQDSLSPLDPSETMTVEVKNNRDNPDYTLPPNTERKDEQGRVEFEQSLVFNIDSLRAGHFVSARKILRDGETNYSGYRTIKLWVHSNDSSGTRKSFGLRLVGSDTNSYYQYRQPLGSGWQEFDIDLQSFSDLKKLPLPADTTQKVRSRGAYSMLGNPNLLSLNRIALCVFNDDTAAGRIFSDEVWFNELRLDDVRRDRGLAMTTGASLSLADLLTLNATYSRTDAHWYGVNATGTGSGVRTVGYGLSGSLSAHKLYLERLGLSLPVGFRYNESRAYSEFGSEDIRLSEQESRDSMSLAQGAGFDLSLTKRLTRWWLTNLTVDRLTPRLSWSRSFSDSRTSTDSSTSLGLGMGYSWSPAGRRTLRSWPGLEIQYLPSSLSLAWSRNQTRRWYHEKLTGVSNTNGSGDARTGQAQLAWQPLNSLNYSLSTARNLKDPYFQGELARRYQLGSEVSRSQRINYSTTLGWLKVVKPSLSAASQYNESHGLAADPQSPPDSLHILNVSNSSNLTLNGGLEVGRWLSKITGLRNKALDDSAEAGTPRWLVARLERLFLKSGGVQASFGRDRSSQASDLVMSRPGMLYQLGLSQDPSGVERFNPLTRDRENLRNSYSLSTSLELMKVSLSLAMRRSDDTIRVGEAANSSRSVTWPEVRASLVGVEKWRLWGKSLSSSGLTSAYSRSIDRTWENRKGLVRVSTRHSFSPLFQWTGRWKKNIGSTLNFDYSSQATDDISGQSRDLYNQSFKTTGSLSYAFRAPKGFKLDLWKLGKKRIKFDSDLSLASDFSYAIRGDRNLIPESEVSAFGQLLGKSDYASITELGFTSMAHEFSISPNARYKFTSSITGEAAFSYGFVKDKISSSNNNSRMSFNATVNIQF